MLTSQLWSEGNHNSRTTTLWLEPIARVIKCTKKWSAPSDQMANFVHPETLWSRIDHIDQIRILHDDRRGKGSVYHVDYIWLATTRLGAGAMKQVEIVVIVMLVKTLPAICIFWRSGGAGYPGWEVARLLVLVLRLLKTMSSNIPNHEGSRPKTKVFLRPGWNRLKWSWEGLACGGTAVKRGPLRLRLQKQSQSGQQDNNGRISENGNKYFFGISCENTSILENNNRHISMNTKDWEYVFGRNYAAPLCNFFIFFLWKNIIVDTLRHWTISTKDQNMQMS